MNAHVGKLCSPCNESTIAQRWWNLPIGYLLPLNNGLIYQLLFAGYKGSSAGPDVHDAVFCAVPSQHRSQSKAYDERLVGDVEFHIRASDWVAHHHNIDPRYNRVILHVVLICDTASTICQKGKIIPTCSLYDIPSTLEERVTTWPCQTVIPALSEEERYRLLQHVGLLRLEQKAHTFVERLREADQQGLYDAYDVCLIPALAEGLGYGRDRDFFLGVGRYLVGLNNVVPEPLSRAVDPSPLDSKRLGALRLFAQKWSTHGVWLMLLSVLLRQEPDSLTETLRLLRSLFCELGLSLARTDILICNVILPFALAVALIEQDHKLVERVLELYKEHPGLPSNRITRMMCAQLHLQYEPRGSCQQQGLHYIYQQTCREKCCNICIAGKRDI